MKKNIITNNWRNEVKEDFANAIVEAKLNEKLRDKLLLSVKNLMRVGNISLTDTDLHNLINTLQSQIDVLKEEQETQADLMQRNRASGVVFSVATETTAGMVKIATDDDLVNGVNAVSMVTPKNLKTYLAKTGGGGTGVAVLDATETTKGISEIATQAEVNDGNDDSKIVTPKKLKPLIDDLKNDTTALENSTKAKAAELGRVDDGLRKDVDTNVNDIAQLKAKETADIKGVVDQIAKLKNTDTDGLTKAISDLAKKEKSDIAGIKTQQQTNTTDINDLKNKTVTLIDATETTKGISEIATQAEVNAGTDDSKIVTPKKLKPLIDDLKNDTTALENSTKAKAAELGRVDDGLRKDVDTNINDIAGIKTQQQTNTTAINDLKNKTVTLIDASESTKGVAEVATQDETNDGNDDSRIVTPKKLKTITGDLDSRATRIRNDVDKNTADLVTHRTDIQQNTTDIVSNTASIATIITTIKKGITTDKLAKSFTVPAVLHDKVEVKGEDTAGHYGYAVAMHNDYLAISDPVLQEVVIYHRDKNNKKIFNLEDIHKGKKHGGFFEEDGQIYVKRKDGKYLDVFEYDENQTNLTFKKGNTINLTLSYGNSLAINDNYLIVGNPQSKTALIYKHSGIQWQLVKQLSGGDSFGSSVAVTDKNIIVAEPTNKKIEIFDLNFNKVKTITGGASYSKLVDGNNYLTTVAEPDNNILKIYKNLAEIASKTVKADCISLKNYTLLATSKVDKKAYIYSLLMLHGTGWFTAKRTKWSGLPDNTQGYTGYNIAGGQYQLVRPVGTTDTYTKYKGGAWVKNGTWGGKLYYTASEIGVSKADAGKITITDSTNVRYGFGFVDGNGVAWIGTYDSGLGRLDTSTGKITITDSTNLYVGFGFVDGNGVAWIGAGYNGLGRLDTSTGKITITDSTTVSEGFGFSDGNGVAWVSAYGGALGRLDTNTGKIAITDSTVNVFFGFGFVDANGVAWIGTYKKGLGRLDTSTGKITITDSTNVTNGFGVVDANGVVWIGTTSDGLGRLDTSTGKIAITDSTDVMYGFGFSDGNGVVWIGTHGSGLGRLDTSTGKIAITDSNAVYVGFGFSDANGIVWIGTNGRGLGFVTSGNDKLYLNTNSGKTFYGSKEVKDSVAFDEIIEHLQPYSYVKPAIELPTRNIRILETDIQERPNKTGNYVSLLGTSTPRTPQAFDDAIFNIDAGFGDACALTANNVLVTNKTDSKLAVYDFKGKKLKEVQLTAGLGSTIDATENEAIVGSETANTVDIVSLI